MKIISKEISKEITLMNTHVVREVGHEEFLVGWRILDFSSFPGVISWHEVSKTFFGVVQLDVEASSLSKEVGRAIKEKIPHYNKWTMRVQSWGYPCELNRAMVTQVSYANLYGVCLSIGDYDADWSRSTRFNYRLFIHHIVYHAVH